MDSNFYLDEIKVHEHKVLYTIVELPKEGSLHYICKGAQDFILYRKLHEYQVCAERSIFCDSKGRLGLVIGKVDIRKGLVTVGNIGNVGNVQIIFAADCRCKWSEKSGIFVGGTKRLIQIATILSPNRFRGCTKISVDGEHLKDLDYMVDNNMPGNLPGGSGGSNIIKLGKD